MFSTLEKVAHRNFNNITTPNPQKSPTTVEDGSKNTVKLNVDYPATQRCEGVIRYTVWAVSFDDYTLRLRLMDLRKVHDKGLNEIFNRKTR